MYLITAYFNEKANRTIQQLISTVAKRTGNTFMTDHQVPPHMTISSIEARSADVLKEPFTDLRMAHQLKKTRIRFVSPGQLLPYVLYITPVLNDELQELSRSVYEKMSGIPETTISRVYKPGSWLPHTTIGKTLDKGHQTPPTCRPTMTQNFVRILPKTASTPTPSSSPAPTPE